MPTLSNANGKKQQAPQMPKAARIPPAVAQLMTRFAVRAFLAQLHCRLDVRLVFSIWNSLTRNGNYR